MLSPSQVSSHLLLHTNLVLRTWSKFHDTTWPTIWKVGIKESSNPWVVTENVVLTRLRMMPIFTTPVLTRFSLLVCSNSLPHSTSFFMTFTVLSRIFRGSSKTFGTSFVTVLTVFSIWFITEFKSSKPHGLLFFRVRSFRFNLALSSPIAPTSASTKTSLKDKHNLNHEFINIHLK